MLKTKIDDIKKDMDAVEDAYHAINAILDANCKKIIDAMIETLSVAEQLIIDQALEIEKLKVYNYELQYSIMQQSINNINNENED